MKQILCIFLCFALVVGTSTVMAVEYPNVLPGDSVAWMIGDPNGDEKIDAADALVVLWRGLIKEDRSSEDVCVEEDCWHIREGKGHDFHNQRSIYRYHYHFLCGDVNKDDYLSAHDALLILQYAVGKIEEFPRTDFTSNRLRVQPYPKR